MTDEVGQTIAETTAVTVPADETSAETPTEAAALIRSAASAPPALAQPEMLVDGLRYLQKRIPEFTQLTVQEKRSHARAANLDPEFIDAGLQVAAVWSQTEAMVNRSAEDLDEEQAEIRRWDNVVVELRAITAGIEAANLKRKHRLGKAILKIYNIVGILLDRPRPEDAHLRPYYENMKRAYLRTQQFRGTKKNKKAGEGTEMDEGTREELAAAVRDTAPTRKNRRS
ncbi:MAG TPA: hypothetical protein VGF69_24090 [Thermoanaerobaculia bacterium]|jgi:hypothetical protein